MSLETKFSTIPTRYSMYA